MTIDDLRMRHSVRAFRDIPLENDLKKHLEAEITYINTHATALNFQIVFDDPEPFAGFRRNYGMFRNTHNYVAMIADEHFPGYKERAGYYGQQFVMEAVMRGLGTCFVAVTFDGSKVRMEKHVYERLVCLIAFGYPEEKSTPWIGRMAAKISHRNSLKPEDFYVPTAFTLEEAMGIEPKLIDGLQAMACAPSAMNKQPARVTMDADKGIRAFVEKDSGYSMIDLGIAEYNFEAVAPGILKLDV